MFFYQFNDKYSLMTANPRSGCPIANTLDLVGDRWTLVIIRDMLNGKKRYSAFLDSPEGITTNILADRLSKLERSGLVSKTPYQDRPKRYEYELTEMGDALLPIVQEMCLWANEYIPGTWVAPKTFMTRKPIASKR